MPTGYTAGVGNGEIISFKEYATDCAKAFGALIHLREDPKGNPHTPIPKSTYYPEQLSASQKELEFFTNASMEDKLARFEKYKSSQLAYYYKQKEEAQLILKRYQNMLVKAKMFNPPTDQHKEYAKFIVSQLEKSIEFDCSYTDDNYYDKQILQYEDMTFEEWQKECIKKEERNIAYYNQKIQEEEASINSKTNWLNDLFKEIDRVEDAVQTRP